MQDRLKETLTPRALALAEPAFKDDFGDSAMQGESTPAGEDVRTVWVDYDIQGTRYKSWAEFCNESSQAFYADSPPTAETMAFEACKQFRREGGSPLAWLKGFAREKRLGPNDRNMHEVKTLCETIEIGGCYDQCNVSGDGGVPHSAHHERGD